MTSMDSEFLANISSLNRRNSEGMLGALSRQSSYWQIALVSFCTGLIGVPLLAFMLTEWAS